METGGAPRLAIDLRGGRLAAEMAGGFRGIGFRRGHAPASARGAEDQAAGLGGWIRSTGEARQETSRSQGPFVSGI